MPGMGPGLQEHWESYHLNDISALERSSPSAYLYALSKICDSRHLGDRQHVCRVILYNKMVDAFLIKLLDSERSSLQTRMTLYQQNLAWPRKEVEKKSNKLSSIIFSFWCQNSLLGPCPWGKLCSQVFGTGVKALLANPLGMEECPTVHCGNCSMGPVCTVQCAQSSCLIS